jgi:tellurite resistance protein
MSGSPETSRLQFFPISWFAVIMGMTGLSIAWSRAELLFGLPVAVSPLLLAVTTGLFILFCAIYAMKIRRYPEDVRAELTHPVKIAFLPTISISLILLSIAFLPLGKPLSLVLWGLGSGLHFIFTLYVLSSWMHKTTFDIKHLNPAWFIPVVGNILVPIAGVHHGLEEISWFFFSIGLFFWPMLTAIIFYRLIFHQSLPERLMPTLFIFIAPPAVALLSWYNLTAAIGHLGNIFYYIAVFFFLLLLSQLRIFLRLSFFLSWWAYSFPIAALTIATLLMAQENGKAFFAWSGGVLLTCLTAVIAVLIVRTIQAMRQRTICVDEGH